ncbi:hypothetical protein AVEN_44601-1 [Araneus ventricosus]|uniref:ribonuclease H n=1 Tax=Araneus ventricosus TaxID=182803 RepID=A0A4Y2R1J7_ARAVE|nr:hypothetical protein AVEN_44601-1 [Araneus ventricosus]
MFLQAYADDLALIIAASSQKNLEVTVSASLDLLYSHLQNLNLQVASEKTLAVVFRGTQNKNRQKRGLATLKRTPIFKLNNRTIRTVDSLKDLGIFIDNQFNWNDHITFLRSKMLGIIKNFHSVTVPNWGTGVSLLKHWYLTVIQPSLLFGAAVWGGSFTKKQINTLHSIQRIALLKISKGYRTCPTDALNVILGFPPLHVVANGLFIKFQIWNKRSNDYDFIDTNNLDFYIKINNLNLNQKVIEFPELICDADYDIYTDSSGTDGSIAASVCIFNKNLLFDSYKFKLDNYNSVFQAELAAINFAAGWALENNFKINIFSDSLSSIEVLKKSNSKSNYINQIKNNMFKAIGSVGLSWVKAHAGIPGNELADQFAKEATINGEFLPFPAPYSFLKKFINNFIFKNWQRHWEASKNDVRVREFIPSVDYSLVTHSRSLLFFITGHGPFPAYLHRFKILNSPNCVCGSLGDADHFAFDCIHTQEFHFTKPSLSNKPFWFRSVLKNQMSLSRLDRVCTISNVICNNLKV